MKNVSKFSILLASLFIVSCTKSGDLAENTMSEPEVPTGEFFVSQEQARATLEGLLGEVDKGTRSTTRTVSGDMTYVYSSSTRAESGGSEDQPMFYVFNMEDEQGFALVSTDERTEPVYVITDEGSYDAETDNPGYRLFMEMAEEAYRQEIEEADSVMAAGGTRTPSFTRADPGIQGYIGVAPLLTTKWDQYWPYCNNCYTPSNLQAYAGCVPIAIAQVTAYHKYPSSYNGHTYNWTAMLAGPTIADNGSAAAISVAHLVRDIGETVEATYRFSSPGTTAEIEKTPKWFSAVRFEGKGTYKSYNRDLIISELDLGRPVITGGVKADYSLGHAWVIDGYLAPAGWGVPTAPTSPDYPGGRILPEWGMMHCNWGWGGDGNGYFHSRVFDVRFRPYADSGATQGPAGNYSTSLSIFVDIKKPFWGAW